MDRPGRSAKKTGAKAVLFTAKVLLAALVIFWLIKTKKLDLSLLGQIHFDLRTIFLMLSGGLCVLAGLFLLGWRLWLLLRSRNCAISYNKVLGFTFIGSFFGSVLPGLVGGDAVRAAYLCGNVSGSKADAVIAVLVDRILGVYSLLLLGSLALILAGCFGLPLPLGPKLLAVAPSAVIVLGLFWLAFINEAAFNSCPVQAFYRRTPQGARKIAQVLRAYLKDTRLVGCLVLISLVNHALVVSSFVVCALLLKDSVPFYAHFVVDPLAMMMNMLMVTPGGAGITEGVFALLFQELGSSKGALIGLLGRILQYLVFIITGCLALFSLKLYAGKKQI